MAPQGFVTPPTGCRRQPPRSGSASLRIGPSNLPQCGSVALETNGYRRNPEARISGSPANPLATHGAFENVTYPHEQTPVTAASEPAHSQSSIIKRIHAMTTTFTTVNVDGTAVFYREAGDRNHPAILLLHGFPTS